jgi:hypothetical protein
MKKQFTLIGAVLGAASLSAFAQGQFNFSNYVPTAGINAPDHETDGTTGLGSGYKADYYWASGTVSDPAQLVNDGLGSSAVTYSGSGYFLGGTQTLNGQTGTITLQVRAWRASDGATWAAASATSGAHVGSGNLITFQLGNVGSPPTSPANLAGLQSFNLAVVGPEPATMALGLMGAGALFLRRRKV